VKLVTEQGHGVAEEAASLGIHANLLTSWKRKFAEQENSSLEASERAELERLREENRRLKMERDILKKATAFFAKESR
jgi:transposase